MPKQNRKGNKKGASTSKKPPLTHFLCVPLVNATSKKQLEDNLRAFKEDVCHGPSMPESVSSTTPGVTGSTHEADGNDTLVSDAVGSAPQRNPSFIAEKAIRPVGALHLTLGVMSLDATALASAISFLSEINIHSLLNTQEKLPNPSPQAQVRPDKPEETCTPLSQQPASLTRQVSPPPISTKRSHDEPIEVCLNSLISMHPPYKTSILYTAPEDPTLRLQPLCEELRKRFQEAGFLIEDTRPLKLHATLVNTIYVKGRKKRGKGKPKVVVNEVTETEETKELQQSEPGKGNTPTAAGPSKEETAKDDPNQTPADEKEDDRSQGHGPDAKAPLRIDARDILERYKDFVWAEHVLLDRIAICEMGAKKILDDNGEVIREEYKEAATLKLPSA